MPTPETIIPLMEGVVSGVAATDEAAAMWVKCCKEVMLMTGHKDKDDWAFINIPDIDEASTAAAGCAPETGATLYGVLYAYCDDAAIAYTAVCDDSDGTIAAFSTGDTRITDLPVLQMALPLVGTDGTEEFHGAVFPRGLAFTNYMTFVADQSGNSVDNEQLRAWVLYRTVVTQGY